MPKCYAAAHGKHRNRHRNQHGPLPCPHRNAGIPDDHNSSAFEAFPGLFSLGKIVQLLDSSQLAWRILSNKSDFLLANSVVLTRGLFLALQLGLSSFRLGGTNVI